MALIRCQVGLRHISGLAEDVAVNTFHFSTADTLQATLDDIAQALIDFYTVPFGANPAVYTFFSANQDDQGNTITMYDLADPEPRVPIDERTWVLPAQPTGDPLPGEVALCLSFQGVKESGQPQARRRGRVFIGRFDKDSSGAGRPTASLQNGLKDAGQGLLTESLGANFWSWIVFSRAHTQSAEDPRPSYPESFALVDNGWVDDAFDTQRRRGLAPTSRSTFFTV